MLTRTLRSLTLLLPILAPSIAHSAEQYCTETNARTLKLQMYPFVPEADRIALFIKENFESGCSGLDLQIEMNQNYYATNGNGLLETDADVYEVDSVFFEDFLNRKNPQLPSQSVLGTIGPAIPFARDIATTAGNQYGIPHWVCSDFLIYKKGIEQIGEIKTLKDAEKVFSLRGNRLLIDLEGSSTLGELYLSIMVAHYGSVQEALKRIDPGNLDSYGVSVFLRLLAMIPAGFGRDRDYHYRNGFYPRQLVRGAGTAFVGYSEDTFYALNEANQSCRKNECLGEDDLNVSQWPFADEGAKPVAWVDMYMLDAKLSGGKLHDAEALIKFLMSKSTYKALVIPPDSSPKYLLPARDDIYSDAGLASAKLYPKFRSLIGAATAVTGLHLNEKLHAIATALNAKLPASH